MCPQSGLRTSPAGHRTRTAQPGGRRSVPSERERLVVCDLDRRSDHRRRPIGVTLSIPGLPVRVGLALRRAVDSVDGLGVGPRFQQAAEHRVEKAQSANAERRVVAVLWRREAQHPTADLWRCFGVARFDVPALAGFAFHSRPRFRVKSYRPSSKPACSPVPGSNRFTNESPVLVRFSACSLASRYPESNRYVIGIDARRSSGCSQASPRSA